MRSGRVKLKAIVGEADATERERRGVEVVLGGWGGVTGRSRRAWEVVDGRTRGVKRAGEEERVARSAKGRQVPEHTRTPGQDRPLIMSGKRETRPAPAHVMARSCSSELRPHKPGRPSRSLLDHACGGRWQVSSRTGRPPRVGLVGWRAFDQ